MAIRNWIQDGTYSRIAQMHYEKGKVAMCVLEVYKDTPDMSYKEWNTMEEIVQPQPDRNLGEDAPAEATSINHPDETVPKIHIARFGDQGEFFTLDVDADKSLHKQVYEVLLALDAFDGAISDE